MFRANSIPGCSRLTSTTFTSWLIHSTGCQTNVRITVKRGLSRRRMAAEITRGNQAPTGGHNYDRSALDTIPGTKRSRCGTDLVRYSQRVTRVQPGTQQTIRQGRRQGRTCHYEDSSKPRRDLLRRGRAGRDVLRTGAGNPLCRAGGVEYLPASSSAASLTLA